MTRAVIVLVVFAVLLIGASSGCTSFAEAVAEEFGEITMAYLETELKWLVTVAIMPTLMFYQENNRWPESQEELVTFSCEQELGIPPEVWAVHQICFAPLADGGVQIDLTRTWTTQDGKPQSIRMTFPIHKPSPDTTIPRDEIESELKQRLRELMDAKPPPTENRRRGAWYAPYEWRVACSP